MVFPATKIHMTGIGGVGMSGVARMLLHEGLAVSGSDMRESEVLGILRDFGADVRIGHDGANVPPGTDMVIVSAAIHDDNPEVLEARRRGIRVVKYAEALGELMAEKKGVAISGTHGKTTTSAMLAWIFTKAQRAPSFVVGAHIPDLGVSSQEGSGEVFIAEACEYDRSFLNLKPQVAVITNIEEDHLDYYRDLADIISAFREFAALVGPDGLIVASAHDRNAISVAMQAPARWESFGVLIEADWRAENLCADRGRYCFDVFHKGKAFGRMRLSIPGVHNVLNALAACAVATALDVEFDVVKGALFSFRGASRRFDVVGEVRGVTVIDDYAHHPTEIQVTLRAAREYLGSGKVLVVFQPHQYSRTRFFLKDFARSFSQADRVIVPDIYFVRDSEQERTRVSAPDLVRELVALGCRAEYIPGWDEIVDAIVQKAAPGDVVITMGAGNVYEVGYALVEKLRSNT